MRGLKHFRRAKFGKLSLGSFSGINWILWFFFSTRIDFTGNKRAWWNTRMGWEWDALRHWAVNDLGISRCHSLSHALLRMHSHPTAERKRERETLKAIALSNVHHHSDQYFNRKNACSWYITSCHQGFITIFYQRWQEKAKSSVHLKSAL